MISVSPSRRIATLPIHSLYKVPLLTTPYCFMTSLNVIADIAYCSVFHALTMDATRLTRSFEGLVLTGIQPLSRELGRGSYGRVFEVQYRHITCAAKEVHSELVQGQKIIDMFLRECDQCSKLRHPNIVKFLGIYYPESGAQGGTARIRLPIMVMEKMAQNLTSFIEKFSGTIPVYLKFSIINDVALGLYYLHSQNPPIIHRDLSPNNILLTDHNVAKIGDLGVAKVAQAGSKKTTMPGTIDFMPPEVVGHSPEYGPPMDVFSFAGIILHTFTQQWPTPSNSKIIDPITRKLFALSEVERRSKYLDLMTGEGAVLKPLIEECLDDDPAIRPLIVAVCEKIQVRCITTYVADPQS